MAKPPINTNAPQGALHQKIMWALGQVVELWNKLPVPRLSAAIAFYTIFSLAPTLVVGVVVAGFVLDEAVVREEIISTMNDLVGQEGASIARQALDAYQPMQGKTIAAIISFLFVLFGASRVLAELRNGMNAIWGYQTEGIKHSIFELVTARLVGVGILFGLGLLLVLSLVLSTMVAAFHDWLAANFVLPPFVLQYFNHALAFALTFLPLAVLLRTLPAVRIPWRYTWLGALFATVGISFLKTLLSLYMQHSMVGSVYGAAGSLIVLLIWINFSAHILLAGGVINKIHHDWNRGYQPKPRRRRPRYLPIIYRAGTPLLQHSPRAGKADSTDDGAAERIKTRPISSTTPRGGPVEDEPGASNKDDESPRGT